MKQAPISAIGTTEKHAIWNDVCIGLRAKVIGNVGNCVVIGANCIVTKNVHDNSVVVGIPGRIISLEGLAGSVTIDYDPYLPDTSQKRKYF